MNRVTLWFAGLTGRERLLVGFAGALAVLVLLVYGIVYPLGTALDEAYARHREVVDRTGRIEAGLAQLKQDRGQSGSLAGPVDVHVARQAEEAGFVLQSNQPAGSDATAIVLPSTRAVAVLGWLDGLAQGGLAIDGLTVTPNADGTVAVRATLRRAGS